MRWSSASTRKAKSRRSIAHPARAADEDGALCHDDTRLQAQQPAPAKAGAPPPCSPPSTSLKARSSGAGCSATGIRNSSAFSMPSSARCRPTKRSTSCSTTTLLTSIPRACPREGGGDGLAAAPSTLHLPLHPDFLLLGQCVEGLFAKLTRHRLKRGVFTSIVELQAAISRFIAETNDMPKPFVWTKSADAILAAVQRGRQGLEAIHSHVRLCQMQASELVACEQARVLGSSGQGRRRGR